jgi:hypothetical protein
MAKVLTRVSFYHELVGNVEDVLEEHEDNMGGICTSYLEWLKSSEKEKKLEANEWMYVLVIYHKYYTEDSAEKEEGDDVVVELNDGELSLHPYAPRKYVTKTGTTLTYTLTKLSSTLRGVLLGYMLYCLSSNKTPKK